MTMGAPPLSADEHAPAGDGRNHGTGADEVIISIVITTYRREDMLSEILGALLPQVRGRPAEVIVVDNCPDAGTRVLVEGQGQPEVTHLHEPRSGVVHARNRGVAAARGTYVVFLDDDEVPCPDWLDSWMRQADGRTDMSFGRIAPRLLAPCSEDLRAQVERHFSRDMGRRTGDDLADRWPYLGTGNAMFHKGRCLGDAGPFDPRFNATGGEDVWLIAGKVKQGLSLVWNHEALVEELVPASRMTLAYLRDRRFNQGRLRCILMYGNGGLPGLARVLIWMGFGALQLITCQSAAVLASFLAPRRRADFLCGASGGAGKLLWWRKSSTLRYSNG